MCRTFAEKSQICHHLVAQVLFEAYYWKFIGGVVSNRADLKEVFEHIYNIIGSHLTALHIEGRMTISPLRMRFVFQQTVSSEIQPLHSMALSKGPKAKNR